MLIETAQKIIEELRQDLYKRTGHKIPAIEVVCNYTLKRTWGLAIADTESGKLTIKLNKKVFDGKHETYVFYKILVHEFCHIADYIINGDMHGHGTPWQLLMYSFGQYPYSMVTESDMNSIGYTREHFYHSCSCKKHKVSAAMHNLILSGRAYRCKLCKTSIGQDYEYN